MQLLLQDKRQFRNAISKLSVFTVLSVLGCMLLGYLFLPPAASFYACLLVYENKTKRVFSYAIPLIMFTVNFLLRGFYSLEAFAYVVVGVIIYLAVTKNISKGEAVFWTTLAIVVLIVLSAVLLSFELTGGAVGVIPLKQFYSNLYLNFRNEFLNKVTSLTLATENGSFFAYNFYEAEALLYELLFMVIPATLILGFIISGFSFKLFSRTVNKLSGAECGISEWTFKTSNAVAYFYIAVAILGMIAPSGGIFGYTLLTLNTFFSVAFAYLGVKYAYKFLLSRRGSPLFSVILIILAFALLSSNAVSIFSYVGAVANVAMNRAEKAVGGK